MSDKIERAPFVPGNWVALSQDKKAEMVRPFYDDYLTRLTEIESNGKYPYNAAFKSRIPGIDPELTGTTSRDEDTAIYLLQQLHQRNGDEAKRDAFLASGGVPVDSVSLHPTKPTRGTIARFGWYVGGTGWQEIEDVRLVRHPTSNDRFAFIPKGKRTPSRFGGGTLYFRPAVSA